MIVILAGLPGSGKSTLAQALVQKLPCAILDKDTIRAALFTSSGIEYSIKQDDFCQEIMLQTAAYLLAREANRYVLLDGRTFSREYQRQRAIDFSTEIKTTCATLECVCSEATALARIQEAIALKSHLAANRTPELYRQLRSAWEPIDTPKLVIDTDENLSSNVERAVQYLQVNSQGRAVLQ